MKFLIFLLPIFLLAIPSLKEVLTYPASYYRDFFLVQYLKKVKDVKQADLIYSKIRYKKDFQLKILAKKFPKYLKIYDKKHINRYNWRKYSAKTIIKNGFPLGDVLKMKSEDVKKLLNYLPPSKLKDEIEIVFKKDYKRAFRNKDYFYKIFFSLQPDIFIPSIYINNLANNKRFHYFLELFVRDLKKKKIKRSLLSVNYNSVNDKDKFLLALNAINLQYINYAVEILKSIKKPSTKEYFWLYSLTKNRYYANKLLKNRRIDFYTLYIYEEFKKEYVIDKSRIFNKVNKPKYDINNPVDVIKFYKKYSKVKDYFKFAEELDHKKTLPLKTLVLDKAFKYRKNYYILPKYDLDDLDLSTKALFYSLARQESRFIPAQTSRSYAIGLMQMMPFLIRSFKPKEDIKEFFTDKVNVKYAKKHVLWLKKRLNNPLFVAYAYNGGIGFTKRKVIPNFKFKGLFQPFLSMEMIPYGESREYAKKVITNYVIYYNMLGGSITLHKILKK